MVDDERVFISFEGGSLYLNRRNGSYITSDPNIQEALESDVAYGSQWVLDPAFDNSDVEEETTPENNTVVTEPEKEVETVVEPEKKEEVVEPIVEVVTEGVVGETTPEPKATGEVIEEPVAIVDEAMLAVNNYTLAKNYIKEKFPEVTRPEIISEEKLREYAKEKGITFPNW